MKSSIVIKFCIFLRGIGFYDFNTPSGLKRGLPGKGIALEVTLNEVSMEAVDLLRKVEGVEFVIQRRRTNPFVIFGTFQSNCRTCN